MRRSTLSLRGHAAPVPQGCLFHCVAIRPPTGVFRACGREPPAAPFLSTAKEMGKRTPAKTTFLHFLGAERDVLHRQSLPRDCGGGSVLSVQRTVPPQLSATAPLPLPGATVGPYSSVVSGRRGRRPLRPPTEPFRRGGCPRRATSAFDPRRAASTFRHIRPTRMTPLPGGPAPALNSRAVSNQREIVIFHYS